MIEELKYPIGKFIKPKRITADLLAKSINDIQTFPVKLSKAVAGLTKNQLNTKYRPNGWTIRQVINHCADSHMNSLVRFKLALTEKKPTIKPYFEDRWAELVDSRVITITSALKMLEGLHQRWTVLLKSLSKEDLKRSFIHPEQGREIKLDETISLYAWHCKHHLAHIINLKKRKGWK